MTIQEAINHAKEVAEEKYKEGFLCYANSGDAENDKKNDECVKCAKEHEQLAKWLEKLQQYRAIGTVDECREARERQRAKKPTPIDYERYIGAVNNAECLRGAYWCPNCKHAIRSGDYCNDCGQAIDWSDTD